MHNQNYILGENEYVWTDENFMQQQLKNNSSNLSPAQKMKIQVLTNPRIEEIIKPFLRRFVNQSPDIFFEERWDKYRNQQEEKQNGNNEETEIKQIETTEEDSYTDIPF